MAQKFLAGSKYYQGTQQHILDAFSTVANYMEQAKEWEGKLQFTNGLFHANLSLIGAGYELINLIDLIYHPRKNPMNAEQLSAVIKSIDYLLNRFAVTQLKRGELFFVQIQTLVAQLIEQLSKRKAELMQIKNYLPTLGRIADLSYSQSQKLAPQIQNQGLLGDLLPSKRGLFEDIPDLSKSVPDLSKRMQGLFKKK